MKKDIYAVVYPLEYRFTERFFKDKTIFVKFLRHEASRLEIRNKIIFYQTKSKKKLVGEATITHIEFLISKKVMSKYYNQVFLNINEMASYALNRTNKKMLTLTLDNIKKYKTPVSIEKPITMSGLYLSKEEYDNLYTRVESP